MSLLTMSEGTRQQWESLTQIQDRDPRKLSDPVCVVFMPPEAIKWLSNPEDRAEVEDQRLFIQKGARRMQAHIELSIPLANNLEAVVKELREEAKYWHGNLNALYNDKYLGSRLVSIRTRLYELASKRNVNPQMYMDIMGNMVYKC